MSLKQALLSSINEKWEEQSEYANAFLSIVYIHPSLAEAIKNEGDDVPYEFNPNEFNFVEDGNYSEIEIRVYEQDALIHYYYE